jgi:hAT family C-terminal dimerisation region
MALDILSIPAMSADPKRLFSGVKITISERRNRLGIYTIKALECLKSWLDIKAIEEDDVDEDLHIGQNSDI